MRKDTWCQQQKIIAAVCCNSMRKMLDEVEKDQRNKRHPENKTKSQ